MNNVQVAFDMSLVIVATHTGQLKACEGKRHKVMTA